MADKPLITTAKLKRRTVLAGLGATVAMPWVARAQGGNVVRIGVPTKTYYPTIIAETAIRQKLFEKEGLKPELTIYRSGAEGFEALAAGAADIVMNSTMSVAGGLKRGVNARCVANAANGYYGWAEHAPYDRIMVTAASDLIPAPLLAQLKPGGRMVIPTGIPEKQTLMLVEKSATGSVSAREILPVRFSELEDPGAMVGAA